VGSVRGHSAAPARIYELRRGHCRDLNRPFFRPQHPLCRGIATAWGWVVLCFGALQFLTGLGVFVNNPLARWVGVVVLAGNTLAQLSTMPAYPFWSLVIIAIDLLAIYGLVVYGRFIGQDSGSARTARTRLSSGGLIEQQR
jgi:hypothetical protein